MTYDEYVKKYKSAKAEEEKNDPGEEKPQGAYDRYMQQFGHVYQSGFSTKGSAMLQDFSSAYRSFVETANSDFKTLGYTNARDMQTAASKNAADLRNRVSSLKTYLAANRGYMSDKDYTDAVSFINGAYRSINDVMNEYNRSLRHYSQWDTEEEYVLAMEKAKADAERLAELTGGYDPVKNLQEGKSGWADYTATQERYSQQAAEAQQAAAAKKEEGYSWEQFWDDLGRWMGPGVNPDTSLPFHTDVNLAAREHQANDTKMKHPDDRWSDEQRYIFGYLWNTERQKAYDYAFAVNNMLNVEAENAQIEQIQGNATDNFFAGVGHTLGSLATAPLGMADYVDDLIAYGSVDKVPQADGAVTPFEYSQAVTGGISQHLNEVGGTLDDSIPIIGGKGWGDVYGLGTSIAQSSMAAYTGGSAQALITFFGSAAASGVDDAKKRGATDGQAIAYGTLAGAAEAMAEMVGVDNLLKIGSSNTMRQLMMNLAKQGAAEGLEEGLTTLMNNFADQLVMQDKSNFRILVQQYMAKGLSQSDAEKQAWLDMANDMAFDMVAGFASGAVHAGPQTAYETYLTGREMKTQYGGFQQELVEQGLESADGSLSHELAAKYQDKLDLGRDLSGMELSRLVQANEQQYRAEDMASIRQAAENRLAELGEIGDVQAVSEALAKQTAGLKLTRAEQRAITGSKYGQRVANELNPEKIRSGEYSSTWAEKLGTNRINAEEYSLIVEDAEAVRTTIVDPNATWFQRSNGYNEALMALAQEKASPKAKQAQQPLPGQENVPAADTVDARHESGAEAAPAADVAPAKVKSIASISDGKVMLKLEDGSEVEAASADLDPEDGVIIETIAKIGGISANDANYILGMIKAAPGVNPQWSALGASEVYRYGFYGMSKDHISKHGVFSSSLTDAQRNAIYETGRNARNATVQSKTQRIAENTTTDKNAAVGDKTAPTGKVHFDGDRNALTHRQKASLTAMEKIADVLGVQIHVFESEVGKNGKRVGANGWYDPRDNSIHIDLHAGANGEGTMLFTLAHELTHHIRKWSPAKFKILSDFLMEEYGKKGVNVDALVHAQIDKAWRTRKEKLSYDAAFEEVVADSMEMMLSDGNVMKRLEKLKAKDKDLWNKIKTFIDELAAKIRSIYKGLKPDSVEGQYVADMGKAVYRLQELFAEALVDASENYQMSEKNTTHESGDVQYSVREDMTDAERYEELKNRQLLAVDSGDISEYKGSIGQIEALPQKAKSKVERQIYDLAGKLGILLKPMSNSEIKFEFQISKNNGLKKSIHNQLGYGGSYGDFAKALINLDRIIPNAILIEAHTEDRYADTKRANNRFEGAYVLIGAFQDSDFVIPVKLEIKKEAGETGNLYVVVAMTKIERTSVMGSEVPDSSESDQPLPVTGSIYSLQQIVSKINTQDADFLKYIPDGMLSKEQIAAKNEAKAAEKAKVDKLRNEAKKFSDRESRTYAEIEEERQELRQREIRLDERKRKAESNPELLKAMVDYSGLFTEVRGLLAKKRNGTATQIELDRIEEIKRLREEASNRVAALQESLGLKEIEQERDEIRETKEALRIASDAAWAREGAERENKAIEKAGLSAPEYFRKKALKAFKTTTNFNEAGYLLPDGKLLNFSGGERNHRYRDHREIGEIYEATQGAAALNRFMADGNIRIMAESPGVDITSGIEPTKDQYEAMRKFVNSHGVKERKFFVDFSDVEGHRAGNYSYEGRVSADRVINDIKHYYATGEIREQSSLAQFFWSDRDTESVSNRSLLANAFEGMAQNDIEKQKIQEYKEKIAGIDAQEQKLRELNAQIKELSFAKGKRDTQKIRELRDEAIKTRNRIGIYDSQLLRLEASKPLQAVLAREKKKAYQRAEQKGKEALDAYRLRAEAKQSEILRDYREANAALRGQQSDAAVMEKEFVRIVKAYERLEAQSTTKSGKDAKTIADLRSALKDEVKKRNADQKTWEAEFDRLLREYEASGRNIAKLEEKIERQRANAKAKIESREKTALRHKIQTFKARLESSLLRPSDRRYIPIDLIKAMVEVCDLIGTDTQLHKADGSINKAQEKRNLTKERLRNLKDEYEKLKTHSDPIYAGEFDEMVYAYLTELRDNYAGKTLNEMSLDDLKEMYEILRAIEETLQDARKLIGWGDAEGVYEAGDAIVAEQNAITKSRNNSKRNAVQKARDASLNLSLSPVRNVERMSGYNGDSALLKLFKKFEQGIRKKNKFVMEAYKSFEGLTSGKEYENAMYTEMGGKKYTDIKGRKFGISKMQMMQAVLSYEREAANNLHHIENGGFTFADLDTLRKGKLKDAISAEYSHRVPAAVNLVAEFNEALKNDQWCQDYMAAARKFFDGAAKDAINETGIALKHRIIAKDKNYIPFEVDKNFIIREISAANDVQQTINSYGMLKDVKDGAPQPLIITGLNNVLDRHIDMVGNVYGLAVEVRNYNKVWNLRSGNNQTVKEAIQTNWGNEGVTHIEQAVQDIQGPRIRERNTLYNKVKSNYISATFLLNLSVVTKQIGSLFSATSMLRWRGPVRQIGNLIWTMVNHKKIAAEVDKYTATAWMRRQGLSDAELHTLLSQAKKPGLFRLWEKAPAAINPAKWITAMDSAVALSLWKYAKQDTAKRTGLKGEELLKATAEFYDEVVENTQSMTDVLHRPEIQKRSDILSESFAMFKTDLYQMAGQLQVTAGRFTANRTKENGMALGRTVYAITMSAVWGQLMTTVFALLRYKVNQYRDEEDEELTYESWLKRQGFGFAGDLMGYIFPIFGSETIGVFENIMYGESDDIVDSIVLTAINNLYDMMITVGSSFKEGEMPEPAKMKQLVIKALQVFGIPANNIIRTYEAIHLHAKDIVNGEFLSFEAGIDRSPKHHIHRIMEAMDEGKIDVAIGLYEEALEETAMGKTEDGSYGRAELKDAESSLKSALGNKFKDGEISRALTIKILTSCFGSEKDEAERTVREWAFRVEYGFSYSDQKQQFMAGNITASEVRSNIMAVEGKTEEEAESRIVGYCRDAYEDGYFTRNEAASAMIVYGGMDKSEAEDKLRYIDVMLQFSDTYVNDAWVDEYYKEVESSGISIEVFVDYRNQVKGIKGEGEKERRMAVIDSLPISDEQKDALYFAEGWAESEIDEAPWHR